VMPERPIILAIPPLEVVPIVADVDRISQVINTYLEHALSTSPADQPVTVRLTMEDAAVRVSVQDTGLAIPLEEQEHLWERFHYAKRAAGEYKQDQGFGLDFYLSRVFIERHHGSVGVQSDPAHDATFWFTLPIEAPASAM
jgi:signal transduction histidine kinase